MREREKFMLPKKMFSRLPVIFQFQIELTSKNPSEPRHYSVWQLVSRRNVREILNLENNCM